MNHNQQQPKQKEDDNKTVGKIINREDKIDKSTAQLGNKNQTKEGTSAPTTQESNAHTSKKRQLGHKGDHSIDTKMLAEPHKKDDPTRKNDKGKKVSPHQLDIPKSYAQVQEDKAANKEPKKKKKKKKSTNKRLQVRNRL